MTKAVAAHTPYLRVVTAAALLLGGGAGAARAQSYTLTALAYAFNASTGAPEFALPVYQISEPSAAACAAAEPGIANVAGPAIVGILAAEQVYSGFGTAIRYICTQNPAASAAPAVLTLDTQATTGRNLSLRIPVAASACAGYLNPALAAFEPWTGANTARNYVGWQCAAS